MEREQAKGTRRQKLALLTAAALALSGAGWSGGAFGNEDARLANQSSEIPTAEQPSENQSERADDQAERPASGDESVPGAAEGAGDNTEPAGAGDSAPQAAQDAGEQPSQAGEQPQQGEQAQQAGDTGVAAARSVPAPEIPQGVKAKAADDAEGIRQVLATSAQAALTKGGFDDLVERLADADRNRLGEAMPKDEQLTTLDGRIEQIRKAWKDKYGEDFGMEAGTVFSANFIGVARGEVEDPALLARNWPVQPTQRGTGQVAGATATEAPANAGSTTDGAGTAAEPTDAAQTASAPEGGALGESRKEARNLEQGRDVGLVRVPASHGLPELTVSLIHEKPDAWRIDIPDQLRAQRLHDSLLNHLTKVGEDAAKWPADKNEAYRLVSHHVLMALLDVGAGSGSEQQPSAGGGSDGQTSGPDLNAQ